MLQGGRRRRIEPLQVGIAHRTEEQQHGREVGAYDLGRVLRGTADEIVERVEADRTTGACASGAAGALVRGGLADATDLEGRETGPGRMAGDTREAAVDHGADVID